MKSLKFGILMILILSFFIGGCAPPPPPQVEKKSSDYYKQKLDNAKEIKIDEAMMSIGKYYDVYADGEKVATIEGKFITTFGNVFEMKDLNGEFLIKEEEVKRWGPFDVTRLAEVKNEKDEIVGYIGEKYWDKWFSVGWSFHFYNKDKQEIGNSDQLNFTMFKENAFYDTNHNLQYQVEANWGWTDNYTMKVYDKSKIPLYNAILMVCIEDAIHDAKKAEDDKKKNK